MANVSFNGSTKIISVTVIPVDGANSIDVKIDLYSDWKEWVSTSDNSKYVQAIRGVGGDPLPGSKALGDTYFLMNGWKIRPYESSHTMTVNGNLYCEDGTSPYVSTVGAYNVMVISAVSQLVSATIQQLPEIEYASFNGGVTIDVVSGTAGTAYPNGTAQSPVNNITDAKTIATERGFDKFFVKGDLTIGATDNIDGYTIVGTDMDSTLLTLTPGCSTVATKLHDLTLAGTCGGRMVIKDCIVDNVLDLCATGGNAYMMDSLLIGNITMKSTATEEYHIIDCKDGGEGDTSPTVDMNGCTASLFLRNYNGTFKLKNVTQGNNIDIDLNSGKVVLDATVNPTTVLRIGGTGVLDSYSTVIPDIDSLMNKDVPEGLKYLIESKDTHSANGNLYYWKPTTGNDLLDGRTRAKAVKTFAKAQQLATDWNNDIIFCIADAPGDETVTTEIINITKNTLQVRGPGDNFVIAPVAGAADSVTINAYGVGLIGVKLGAMAGYRALKASYADELLLENLHLRNLPSGGVLIENTYNTFIRCSQLHSITGTAIEIGTGSSHVEIEECHICTITGIGLNITATGVTAKNYQIKSNVQFQGCTTAGIQIGTGANYTIIGADTAFTNNGVDIIDNGNYTNDLRTIDANIVSVIGDPIIAGSTKDTQWGGTP
jgi:hypothetical protein